MTTLSNLINIDIYSFTKGHPCLKQSIEVFRSIGSSDPTGGPCSVRIFPGHRVKIGVPVSDTTIFLLEPV